MTSTGEVRIGPLDPETLDDPELQAHWYLVAGTGLANFVIGILVLVYPHPSLRLLGVFLGVDLLIAAVVMIVRGVDLLQGDDGGGQGTLLVGVLALIAGVVVIKNPGGTVTLIAVAFALFMIVAGALDLGHGLVRREHRWPNVGKGVLLVGAGTLLVSWPDIGLKTLTVIAGIALALYGAAQIMEGLALWWLKRGAPALEPTEGGT
jgi:uncharacterized membrane protein HdeD (DUF308 family)